MHATTRLNSTPALLRRREKPILCRCHRTAYMLEKNRCYGACTMWLRRQWTLTAWIVVPRVLQLRWGNSHFHLIIQPLATKILLRYPSLIIALNPAPSRVARQPGAAGDRIASLHRSRHLCSGWQRGGVSKAYEYTTQPAAHTYVHKGIADVPPKPVRWSSTNSSTVATAIHCCHHIAVSHRHETRGHRPVTHLALGKWWERTVQIERSNEPG